MSSPMKKLLEVKKLREQAALEALRAERMRHEASKQRHADALAVLERADEVLHAHRRQIFHSARSGFCSQELHLGLMYADVLVLEMQGHAKLVAERLDSLRKAEVAVRMKEFEYSMAVAGRQKMVEQVEREEATLRLAMEIYGEAELDEVAELRGNATQFTAGSNMEVVS